MEVSTHLKKKAKGYNTTWQYLAMADLMAIGYSESDAYAIAFSENTALAMQQNNAIKTAIVKSDKFQELLLTRKRALAKNAATKKDENGDIELIGAEETAREILKIAQSMPEQSKERGEMFVRYADLIRKNDTQTAEDDERVIIYMPMKCTMCPAKIEFEDKKLHSTKKD